MIYKRRARLHLRSSSRMSVENETLQEGGGTRILSEAQAERAASANAFVEI